MADNTTLSQRPECQWRDIIFPITSREVRFGIKLAEYPILYRRQMTEALLVGAKVFTYDIPATDGLKVKPYAQWFSVSFEKFHAAFANRTVGALQDPVYGGLQAIPYEWSDTISVADRNGARIRASFVEYVSDGMLESEPVGALAGKAGFYAKSLDDAILKLPKTSLPSLPGTSFTQMISQIKGIGDQIIRQGQRATGMLQDIASHCMALVDTFDRLANPGESIGAKAAAVALHKVVRELIKRVSNPTKMVKVIVTSTTILVAALAAQYGISMGELLALNPDLVKRTRVPPGTQVKIYVPAG